jgi:hypothetical protein
MVGVFVTFHYDDGVDAEAVTRIAKAAADRFRGLPGLRSKAFTVDEAAGEATNFSVWDDEAAARAFFDGELRARVTGLYGVSPSIRFVEIAELVDNAS